MIVRRRGTAIVETPRGILVTASRNKLFLLPGGGAERWESRKKAAIRELYEETGLRTKRIKFLFEYIGSKRHSRNGKPIRNHAKVFLVEAKGHPHPSNEIKYIDFWNRGSKVHITSGTRRVIESYLKQKGRFK